MEALEIGKRPVVLFDFDGTVFDTVEGITKSVRYAINLRGMDAELDSLRCFAGLFIRRLRKERKWIEMISNS